MKSEIIEHLERESFYRHVVLISYSLKFNVGLHLRANFRDTFWIFDLNKSCRSKTIPVVGKVRIVAENIFVRHKQTEINAAAGAGKLLRDTTHGKRTIFLILPI